MAIDYDKSSDDWFDHDGNLDAISENSFNEFLRWEKATRDTIDFKKIYVDMAGDLNAGLALSEIVYWYLPNKENKTRLRVKRDGKRWIACQRHNWWDRTRMSPKQVDRALAILVGAGLIEKKRFRFKGEVTVHVTLIHGVFQRRWNELLASPVENPFRPKGKTGITEKVKPELPKGEIPYTESTTETTTESIASDDAGDKVTVQPKPLKKPRLPKPDTVPREKLNPMLDALVLAFGYTETVWKTPKAGELRAAAKSLCLAEYEPAQVATVHTYCEKHFTHFGPNAIAKHAPDALKAAPASNVRHANKPQPAAAPELSESDRAALAAEVRAMREGLNGNG